MLNSFPSVLLWSSYIVNDFSDKVCVSPTIGSYHQKFKTYLFNKVYPKLPGCSHRAEPGSSLDHPLIIVAKWKRLSAINVWLKLFYKPHTDIFSPDLHFVLYILLFTIIIILYYKRAWMDKPTGKILLSTMGLQQSACRLFHLIARELFSMGFTFGMPVAATPWSSPLMKTCIVPSLALFTPTRSPIYKDNHCEW